MLFSYVWPFRFSLRLTCIGMAYVSSFSCGQVKISSVRGGESEGNKGDKRGDGDVGTLKTLSTPVPTRTPIAELNTEVDVPDTGGEIQVATVQPTATATAAPIPTGAIPLSDRVAVFAAVGHAGRRLLSCDGGQSWAIDKSHDDELRCWLGDSSDPKFPECDHNMFPGSGLAFGGDGWLYASHGWGQATTVVKSHNGIEWQPILRRMPDTLPLLKVEINAAYNAPEVPQHNTTFAGIVAPNGRLVGGHSSSYFTVDRGVTWQNGGNPNLAVGHYRKAYQLTWNGKERIFFFGDTHGNGFKGGVYSDDGGTNFVPVTGWENCNYGTLAHGNAVTLMFSENSHCRSTDGGASWASLPKAVQSNSTSVVFGANKFLHFAGNDVWSSPTGEAGSWTKNVRTGAAGVFDLVAFHTDLGVYVAFKQSWNAFYAQQKAFRSVDGIAWTELSASSFKGGHPIRYLKAGHVAKSTQCTGN